MKKTALSKEVKQLEKNVALAAANPLERMHKLLFSFPYPKLALLALSVVAAYEVFTLAGVRAFLSTIGDFGYFGMFVILLAAQTWG